VSRRLRELASSSNRWRGHNTDQRESSHSRGGYGRCATAAAARGQPGNGGGTRLERSILRSAMIRRSELSSRVAGRGQPRITLTSTPASRGATRSCDEGRGASHVVARIHSPLLVQVAACVGRLVAAKKGQRLPPIDANTASPGTVGPNQLLRPAKVARRLRCQRGRIALVAFSEGAEAACEIQVGDERRSAASGDRGRVVVEKESRAVFPQERSHASAGDKK